MLKVFLIDRVGFIREIYTSTFLHLQTLLNDIETLVMRLVRTIHERAAHEADGAGRRASRPASVEAVRQ